MEKDTRTKLMEAATRLFAQKGYSAVSVRELTMAAKVNVSAVSYYFENKEGLYKAVLAEQFAPTRQAMRRIEESAPLPYVERLAFYARQVARAHAKRPLAARFIVGELANPTQHGTPIIEAHILRLYEFLCATLREGMARGLFRADLNVPHAAHALAGAVNFFFLTRPLKKNMFHEASASDEDYIEQALRIYLEGVMASDDA